MTGRKKGYVDDCCPPGYLSIKAAAQATGFSATHIRNLIRMGAQLEVLRVHGTMYMAMESVALLSTQNAMETREDVIIEGDWVVANRKYPGLERKFREPVRVARVSRLVPDSPVLSLDGFVGRFAMDGFRRVRVEK